MSGAEGLTFLVPAGVPGPPGPNGAVGPVGPAGPLVPNLAFLNQRETFVAQQTAPITDAGGGVFNVMADPYNVAGNGITDDTLALRAVIAAAGAGATLLFPYGKTFLISGILAPLTNQTWWGYGAKIKRCNAVSSATATAIAIGPGPTAITVTSAAGFFVGMDVNVFNGVTYDNNNHRITGIAGNVVTVSGAFSTAFPGGGTLYSSFEMIQNVSGGGPLQNIRILGLELDGNRANNTLFAHWDIHMDIDMNNVNQGVVRDCYIHDSQSEGILAAGTGLNIESNGIINCGGNGIHLGGTVDCVITGNFVQNVNLAGIATGHADGCIIASNQVKDTIVVNNYCQNGISGIASWDSDDDNGLIAIGNIIRDCTSTGFEGIVAVGAGSVGNLVLIGNQFYNSVSVTITDNDSGFPANRVYRCIVNNNYFEDTRLAVGNIVGFECTGNQFRDSGTVNNVITITQLVNAVISNNEIEGGAVGFSINGACINTIIAGNAVRGFNQTGMGIASTVTAGPVKISGNLFYAAAGETVASPNGILMPSAGTGLFVSDNVIDLMGATGATIGIRLPDGGASTNGAMVKGNQVRVGGNAAKSSILSTNNNSQKNIVVDNVLNKAPTLGTGDTNVYRNNDVIL